MYALSLANLVSGTMHFIMSFTCSLSIVVVWPYLCCFFFLVVWLSNDECFMFSGLFQKIDINLNAVI